MKIDVFSHILPSKYVKAMTKKNPSIANDKVVKNSAVKELDMRFRLMEKTPDVLQVLTIANPTLESQFDAKVSMELAMIANDELAELVNKYPDKFIAGVACLPLQNIDLAMAELDRAIKQLGLKGVQIWYSLNGVQLNDRKFKPLFEKMAFYDLPIWIHPCSDGIFNDPFFGLFGWPYVSTRAMLTLVSEGIFEDYPNIKFIIHHCGAMAPYFADRIKVVFPKYFEYGDPARNYVEHFQKFYTDTALYGGSSALMCAYEYFGADHILFGTDAPLPDPFGMTLETIEAIQQMEISESDRNKIFSENARKLLKETKYAK